MSRAGRRTNTSAEATAASVSSSTTASTPPERICESLSSGISAKVSERIPIPSSSRSGRAKATAAAGAAAASAASGHGRRGAPRWSHSANAMKSSGKTQNMLRSSMRNAKLDANSDACMVIPAIAATAVARKARSAGLGAPRRSARPTRTISAATGNMPVARERSARLRKSQRVASTSV